MGLRLVLGEVIPPSIPSIGVLLGQAALQSTETSHAVPHLHVLLIYCLTYLFESQREREISIRLIHSPRAYQSWAWPSQSREPGTQFRSPTVLSGTQLLTP